MASKLGKLSLDDESVAVVNHDLPTTSAQDDLTQPSDFVAACKPQLVKTFVNKAAAAPIHDSTGGGCHGDDQCTSLDHTVLSGDGGASAEAECKLDPLVKRIDSKRTVRKNKFIKQLSDRLYEQQQQQQQAHQNSEAAVASSSSQSFDLNNKTVKEKRERFFLNKNFMSIQQVEPTRTNLLYSSAFPFASQSVLFSELVAS